MKKLLKMLKKDERGLTLVELLAVIVILAIVGAIAFVAIGNVIDNSKEDAHIANAQQIISAVKLAEASGEVSASDLKSGVNVFEFTDDDETTPGISQLGEVYDPWNNEPYVNATVYKDDDVYKIDLTAPSGNCPLTQDEATEQQLLQEGRKLCD